MKIRILALLMISVLGACNAQLGMDRNSSTISITGDAEVKVVPDRVAVYLGVETRNKEIGAASAQNDVAVRQVLTAVRSLGVDPATFRPLTITSKSCTRITSARSSITTGSPRKLRCL